MKSRANIWLLLAVVLFTASLWAGLRGGDGGTGDKAAISDEPPVHLLVLNGTGRKGLAREMSLMLAPVGCVVERVDNAPAGEWPHCLLVNRRLAANRAARLAASLGGISVVREWDDRATEDAALVLGDDWADLREALTGENDAK